MPNMAEKYLISKTYNHMYILKGYKNCMASYDFNMGPWSAINAKRNQLS